MRAKDKIEKASNGHMTMPPAANTLSIAIAMSSNSGMGFLTIPCGDTGKAKAIEG
jgi:hypothetical protein